MKLTIELDEDDYRDLNREIAFRQRIGRPLPEGESDRIGGIIGEIVRDLWEYRGEALRDNPPDMQGVPGVDL